MEAAKKTDMWIILAVFILGSAILVVPIHYIIAGLIAIVAGTYLGLRPNIAFYLTVFFLPFSQFTLLKIPGHHLNLYNLSYHICLVAVIWNMLNFKKPYTLYTKLNKWFVILIPIFLFAGFHSPNMEGGMSFAFRYTKAIILFFMTIYLHRTKQIRISTVIKLIIISAIIQVGLVVFPLTHESMVHSKPSPRGYLGLLGIGPLIINQAKGTFAMFSDFGFFLNAVLFLILPIFEHISKDKFKKYILISILFLGIFLTYSRGAMAVFIGGSLYYLFLKSDNRLKLSLKFLIAAIPIVPLILLFIFKSGFLETINFRSLIWYVHFTYISENFDKLWLGTGFSSFLIELFRYLPNTEAKYLLNFLPHNYFIYVMEEMGFIFGSIFLSFLAYIFVDTFRNSNKGSLITRCLNQSINILMFIIFVSGMSDQSFYHTHMFTFSMLLFSLNYTMSRKPVVKYY